MKNKKSHPEGWPIAVSIPLTAAVAEKIKDTSYASVSVREVPERG